MAELLDIQGMAAGHGGAEVIRDISFGLRRGEALAVLGRNGAGKTTLIDSIVGLTRRLGGRVVLEGRDITALSADARARAGIGWVPQQRHVFASLTVAENLTVTARPGPWTSDRVLGLFPRLAERRDNLGRHLSGGEQQMLAIGRALMLNPRVLLLDEPSEGLAPVIVRDLIAALALIRAEGMATILVEQHARQALAMTNHALILDRGRIVDRAPSAVLAADPARLAAHLGVLPRAAQG